MYITKAQYAYMLKMQARRDFLRSVNNVIGVILTAILFVCVVCLILICA